MATQTTADTIDLQARARAISAEAKALSGTVEETLHDVETYVRERMRTHPYATLAAAAGVGYVLGGGLPSRLTAVLLALGSRMALEVGARELTARLATNQGGARPGRTE
jgi:hypothetical protein